MSKSGNPVIVYKSLRRLTDEGYGSASIVFDSRLLRAVQQNLHQVALYLIQNKIDLNTVEHGFNALNLAIHRRNRDVVNALIIAGANLDICDESHILPPLFQVIAQDMPEIVQRLLDSACDVNIQVKGETAAHIAAEALTDPVHLVKTLVDYGADLSVRDAEGTSVLHLCAKYGHANVTKLLVSDTSERSCDRNFMTTCGDTALHVAMASNQWSVAEVLLETGCPATAQNNQGHTPLICGIMAGHPACVQNLLNRQPPLEYIDLMDHKGYGALHHTVLAARQGKKHPEITDMLLQAGACVNLCSDAEDTFCGVTPLHAAATHGQREILRSLLKGSADTDVRMKPGGKTALFVACEIGNEAVAQILLDYKTNPDQVDKFGVTPLGVASSRGHVAVTKLLLVAGAAANHLDQRDRSALLVAARSGNAAIAELLIKAGANPDSFDQQGKGPIHAAIAFPCMDLPLLNLLIEAGCDPLNLEEFIRIMLDTGILTPTNMGKELHDWYISERKNPKSLKRICRHWIRVRLIMLKRCQLQEFVLLKDVCGNLPLPGILQRYVSARFIE